MPMGRKRKSNPLGLPDRVYIRHGAFYYVHKDGRYERLGTDVKEAKRKGNLYNDPNCQFGTMQWYLDSFIVHCEKRVGLSKAQKGLSQRTYEDYKGNVEPLKRFFGRMTPLMVEPKDVAKYLDIAAEIGRPIRANRGKACLSACFTWLIRTGEGGVKINPCIGVRRNPEQKRERYITDDEYMAVYALATSPVRALMALV